MNKKGLIGQIIFWLFIFVVGSLIVNFIVAPSSMSIVGDKVSEVKNFFQLQKEDVNYTEINVRKDILSCSTMDMAAQSVGRSPRNSKKNICTHYCGQEDFNYWKFKCDRDQLTCYCIDY